LNENILCTSDITIDDKKVISELYVEWAVVAYNLVLFRRLVL